MPFGIGANSGADRDNARRYRIRAIREMDFFPHRRRKTAARKVERALESAYLHARTVSLFRKITALSSYRAKALPV